jgi:transcriptional regulator of acetoin/glycerol metabolism
MEDFGVVLAPLLPRLGGDGATLRPDALLAMVAYDWPLNIRELENVLRAGLAMARGEPLGREHLPAQLRDARPGGEEAALEARLRALLEEHQGNISHVARAMGKTRMQIHRWLKRFGIDHTRLRR